MENKAVEETAKVNLISSESQVALSEPQAYLGAE